ncbi:adenylyl-sulfate kinase [Flavihumibacter stibioxidans]|uniref:adenylyl-sulfate kinase n=1 Tax=Flavihumibacter stibioxidans TaxID=1834163 RepID=UPI00165093E4|nr:adenylyl-sulfate kinase [Flavihumibacter stibioxidans]
MNKLPGQNGIAIWLFGLSGAGKSTIAILLERMLAERGIFSIRLDGDELRDGVNKGLGFSDDDRSENIRRTAEIARLLTGNNVITICSLITPLGRHRKIARDILGDKIFEVFVDCPLEVCANRDVKGLYKKAKAQMIEKFTGFDSSFEKPDIPTFTISTQGSKVEECASAIIESLISRIRIPLLPLADGDESVMLSACI